MRFPIAISGVWRPLFSVFGFKGNSSYVELEDGVVSFHFGTASETVPLSQVSEVVPRDWPFYYGLGAKLGPDGGVAYVGSTEGVVQVRFSEPRPMNVWGPFATKKARCVTVSLEDAEGFMNELKTRLAQQQS